MKSKLTHYQLSQMQQIDYKAKLLKYLESKKIRNSEARNRFFEIIMGSSSHVELSEILKMAKKEKIAEATVYRSLKLFIEAGVISKVEGGKNKTYYEAHKDHHDHMICVSCGDIIEFHSKKIEDLQSTIAKKVGFKIHTHRHELRGWCLACSRS